VRSRNGQSEGLGGYRTLIVVLALPLLLFAKSDRWMLLAEHDLTFARQLATDRVKFGPRFMDEVIDGRVFDFGCDPRPSRLAGLDGVRIQQIRLYAEHHCSPWHEAWSDVLSPCDGDRFVPKWCKAGNEDLLAARLRIGPYFETLTAAMAQCDGALERYNIMAVITDRLDDKVLRSYPGMEEWLSTAVSVFLENARPEGALEIGWQINRTPFGANQSLAMKFRAYLDRVQGSTSEERRLLKEVARALEGKSVSPEVRSLLDERFGAKSAAPPLTPVPNRTNRTHTALLLKRLDTYYSLVKDRQFNDSWDLVARDYREEDSQDSYVRTEQFIWRNSELLGWKVKEIQVKGDSAKVLLEMRRKERAGLFRRNETLRQETTFWVFEGKSWYNMIKWPGEWEDNQAVEVPLPQRLQLLLPGHRTDEGARTGGDRSSGRCHP